MSSTKINQLQLLQQSIQQLAAQKQQLQSQIIELNSALTELKATERAYKIVGKIMIASSPEHLSTELRGKRELVEVRIKNFEKQEQKLTQESEKLQQNVMEELRQQKKK